MEVLLALVPPAVEACARPHRKDTSSTAATSRTTG